MKKPTIKKMKLLVAKMLPEYVTVEKCSGETEFLWEDEESGYVTPLCEREWLYICHLAEQKLTYEERCQYLDILLAGSTYANAACAPAGQRLEALCRHWFPNLFQ